MAEYFFELLTEEIPAWMLESALETLGKSVREIVHETGALEPAAQISANATSRRITLHLKGLQDKQADHVDEIKGPPRKAAFDAEGKPTQALLGFAKKNNVAAEDAVVEGEYVILRRNVTGRSTGDILRERIPQAIETLRWPKMMRWGNGEHSYIRPIHSVISILDGA